jgi:hypothetical protein
MVIAQLEFNVYTKVLNGDFTKCAPLSGFATPAQLGYVNVEIANNQVIKKLTLTETVPGFNKDTTGVFNTLDLETSIVIPPLLPFMVELQLPAALPAAPVGFEYYVECQIIGVGGIIAPRTTF